LGRLLGSAGETAFFFSGTFSVPGAILNEVDRVGDAALVDAVRRGDEAAFARLYAAHQPAIYRYALRMCGAGAADDVVQDTFTALLRGGRYDERRGTLSAYLFGVARHHILKRIAIADQESPLDVDPLDDTTPFDDVSRGQTVDSVRAAVDALPPVYREAIVLCELHELDYAAAAAVMQVPIGTVRSRLHRAKALLCARLTPAQVQVKVRHG
jgi:RNA polymerase sigma factor (sigma-70 family)